MVSFKTINHIDTRWQFRSNYRGHLYTRFTPFELIKERLQKLFIIYTFKKKQDFFKKCGITNDHTVSFKDTIFINFGSGFVYKIIYWV